MPAILNFIQDGQNANLHTLQLKFNAAIRLYEQDNSKYADIAVRLSSQYLDYLFAGNQNNKWESGYHLKEFAGADLGYLPYSTCAFHILLQKDKAKALEILRDLVSKKFYVSPRTLEMAQRHLGHDAFPYIEMAVQADNGGIDHYRSLIALLEQKFDSSQYLPLVWKLAGNKSRPLKELVAKIVAENDDNAEAKAIELLENKSAEVRQTAALVLTQFSSPAANRSLRGRA